MSRTRYSVTVLGLFALFMAGAPASRAAVVPVTFSGGSQAFVGVSTVFGTLEATGGGQAFNAKSGKVEPFVLTPPTIHPLNLQGGFALVNSQPNSQGPANFDITPTQINDINKLNVDLLNGSSVPFAFNTVTVTTNSSVLLLQNVPVDFTGDLDILTFAQTGAATLTPLGPNVGTFSVPGDFFSQVSNFNAKLFGVVDFPLSSVSDLVSGPLAGTYTISGPPNAAKITLDGTVGLAIPVSETFDLGFDLASPLAMTVSGSAAAVATIYVNVGFHLEADQLVVPEPGSIALMGLGLALCAAVVWRRRRTA
ncbi:MAG: PEP-CTERM sorting domain-containing protein [Pirellulales bacterium]